eukprot:m.185088 g.185088  ORF g.185088 m.185088 type:complete len:271 (+) comp16332_c0_seq1:263-1075(+)
MARRSHQTTAAQLQETLDRQSAELLRVKIDSAATAAASQGQMARVLRSLERDEDQAAALRDDNAALKDNHGNLERDNAGLRAEISTLQDTIDRAAARDPEFKQLQDDNSRLQHRLEMRMEGEQDKAAKGLERDSLATENERLHRKLTKLKRDLERLHDKFEDVQPAPATRSLPDISELLWTLHPGAGKLMRSARDFFPGDAPTQHDVDSQLPLTRGEIVYVNVSNARAPDGMVKATRLHEQDDQGFIPFDLMMDLDDDEHAAVRNTLNES